MFHLIYPIQFFPPPSNADEASKKTASLYWICQKEVVPEALLTSEPNEISILRQ